MRDAAPRLIPRRTPAQGTVADYAAPDGRRLRYRVVESVAPARHRLVYLHGIESHGGWFVPAALGLADRGCTTYLLDRRGSGLNRDRDPGDAADAATLLGDVRAFRAHIGNPPVVLVGLSWGGKLATAAALDQQELVRALVLVAPGLRVRLRLPFRGKVAYLLGFLDGGRKTVSLPIDDRMFAIDPHVLDFVARDEWRTRRVTTRLLRAGRSLDREISRGIGTLRVPVLLCLAGRDPIVDDEGVLALLGRLRAGALRVRRFEDCTHSIQLERTEQLVDEIASFLDDGIDEETRA